MRKYILVLAFAFALAPRVALADTIDNSVGNTVVVRATDGATIQVRVRADGTLLQTLPDGTVQNATWRRNGDQFCQTPSSGEEVCRSIAAGKNVGDSWTETDANGATITVSIVAGQ